MQEVQIVSQRQGQLKTSSIQVFFLIIIFFKNFVSYHSDEKKEMSAVYSSY